MHVFAVGVNDKTIWVKSSGDGENWGEWQNFEKQTDAAVTPVVFDDVLFVFAKELDYKISVRSKARTGGWSAWESFNGTSKTAFSSSGVSQCSICLQDPLQQPGRFSSSKDRTYPSISKPAAVRRIGLRRGTLGSEGT